MKKPTKHGKQFEETFKNSVPVGVFYYRFKDSPSGFGQDSDKVRFTQSNICDCMVIAPTSCFLLELKTVADASLPFGNIRDNQIKEMTEADKFDFLNVGFIVNFRRFKRTYYLPIQLHNQFVERTDRRSFPMSFFESYCELIPQDRRAKKSLLDLHRLLDI